MTVNRKTIVFSERQKNVASTVHELRKLKKKNERRSYHEMAMKYNDSVTAISRANKHEAAEQALLKASDEKLKAAVEYQWGKSDFWSRLGVP